MKILFVCSRNRLRSPTAEAIFSSHEGIEATSAGTSPDAENPVSVDLIEWADVIFAMESIHRKKISDRFGGALRNKKVVVLGIPDKYAFMDPRLIKLLEQKVPKHLS